eukprot:TRINITY_DN15940_c0_g1_i1.p1 TRINITY_DN15940_c0_g1~~TRINITY_DN15940_c0_g1_i1.p1  ORF type:complete len:312 (-),score=64.62 TRINITY_DN15940_c0_g1_i1:51-986(-)
MRAFALLLVIFVASTLAALDLRPIIGIVSEPTDGGLAKFGNSFVAASYVKFVESGGARVVPIPHNLMPEQLEGLAQQINGVLVPGGGVDLQGSDFYRTVKFLVDYSIRMAAVGEWFPIHATCLGFETVNIVVSGDDFSILTAFDSENLTLPLDFTDAAKTSRLYGSAPRHVIDILDNQAVTMNNHAWGVSLSNYQANNNLTNFFNILSTNVDRAGKTFVSSVEGKTVPVYATQFHPEKPMYEWPVNSAINHDGDSIVANTYFAQFFVNQTRLSSHSFADPAVEKQMLIYNYAPVYTEDVDSTYEQCYFFNF